MKTVVFIPYWAEYSFPEESLNQRDTVTLGGYSLIDYAVRIADQVDAVDYAVVYASDERVLDSIQNKNKCSFVQREKDLDAQGVSIEQIISRFLQTTDADMIVLMHPKNPFLKASTVSTCIEKVQRGDFDSAFIASKARKLAWFKGEPLNYSLEKDVPGSSAIEPVLLETSSLYVFTRKLFESVGRRVGSKPYIHEIGHFEGFEVDRPDDFAIAELIVNAGLEFNGA